MLTNSEIIVKMIITNDVVSSAVACGGIRGNPRIDWNGKIKDLILIPS
jgi:hypothetical protein